MYLYRPVIAVVLCNILYTTIVHAHNFVVQYTREAAKISGLHHMSLYKQTSHLEQKYSSQPRDSGFELSVVSPNRRSREFICTIMSF